LAGDSLGDALGLARGPELDILLQQGTGDVLGANLGIALGAALGEP
jgi:hypothetical protein